MLWYVASEKKKLIEAHPDKTEAPESGREAIATRLALASVP